MNEKTKVARVIAVDRLARAMRSCPDDDEEAAAHATRAMREIGLAVVRQDLLDEMRRVKAGVCEDGRRCGYTNDYVDDLRRRITESVLAQVKEHD